MKQVEEKSGKQEGLCLATARLLPGRGKGGGKWGGVEGLGEEKLEGVGKWVKVASDARGKSDSRQSLEWETGTDKRCL